MAATIKIVVEVSGGLGAVKKDIDDLGETAKRSGGGFNALQEIAVGALRAIGAAAINLAGAALQKLGGFLVDSIGVAGNFEGKMNEVGAALGKGFEPGTEALGEFKDLFISLGKELPVSTAEVQDAALALVKGGLDPAVVKAGALRDSLNFAAAAGMGLADAAELTIKQLGTFVPIGASVEEQTTFMANAQNLLVKAAGASTLNVDRLGDAMLAAGGQARAAGLDYEEFVTTMGLISPSFGSAAEAGTSFKNFLTRMNPSTKAAKDAMSELGLMTTSTTKIMQFLQERGIKPLGTDLDTLGNQFTELMVAQGQTAKETGKIWDTFAQSQFFDMDGKFVGMAKASELLKTALTGLSDQQRIATLQAIFGNDAMGAATALAGAGADGFQAFADKMMAANGVAGQSAATQQGFNFQLENMKGSLEALQITIGTALLPVLADLIGNYITPGINAVMGLTESFLAGGGATSLLGDATAILQGVWASLQPALLEIWRVLETQVWPILNDLAMTLFPIVQTAIQVLVGFWNDVLVPALQAFWQFLTTFVLPIIAALAGWLRDNLPGAVQVIGNFLTGTLFPAFHKIYDFISVNVIPILADVAQWLIENVPVAIQKASDFWNNVLWPALQKVWAFIQDNVIPIVTKIATEVFDTLNAAVQDVSTFWTETLWPALQKVWQFIQDKVIPLLTSLANTTIALVKKEVDLMTAVWNVLWAALSKIWEFIDKNIIPIFSSLVTKYVADLKTSFAALSAFWTTTFVPAMQKLYDIINDYLAPKLAILNENILQPMKGFFQDIGFAVDDLIKWIDELVESINAVEVPDWLKGESPPPMAEWFDYIGSAVAGVNAQLPELKMNLATSLPGGGGGNSYSSASSRSFTYAPQYSGSGALEGPMDLALATSLAGV